MKILITYKNWLLKTRGKIEPKVGDYVTNNINGEKSLIDHCDIENKKLFDDLSYEGFNYVEIKLPEIEWVSDSYKENWVGKLNGYPIFYIEMREVNTDIKHLMSDNCPIFKGTLEECKQEANKLIFKL